MTRKTPQNEKTKEGSKTLQDHSIRLICMKQTICGITAEKFLNNERKRRQQVGVEPVASRVNAHSGLALGFSEVVYCLNCLDRQIV